MKSLNIVLVGNPNVGKTSLFNELTGLRHRVSNYAGVTVEIEQGALHPRHQAKRAMEIFDLPGTYSLTPISDDEAIVYQVLQGATAIRSDVIVVVMDATNIARNLYFVLQLLEYGRPLVIAYNMADMARAAGIYVAPTELENALGIPVIETVAREGKGIHQLIVAIEYAAEHTSQFANLPVRHRLLASMRELSESMSKAWVADNTDITSLQYMLANFVSATQTDRLSDSTTTHPSLATLNKEQAFHLVSAWIMARYREVDRLLSAMHYTQTKNAPAMQRSVRIDRILTHRVWGLAIFVLVMVLLFQSIFSWAQPLMDGIESIMGWLSEGIDWLLGPGVLHDLLSDGVIAGVGNVLVFIPQIALLFFFLGLLEDSGYMARAAFLIDRLMARVGLHGRAFIPLLSGYACAIPAILSTRSISRFRDRLVTILMIPWMSCSARLPIYLLIIGTLFVGLEDFRVGPLAFGGLVLVAMYALSTLSALTVGAIYKRTILKGPTPPLILELPPYRWPRLRHIALHTYDRTMDFIRGAGTVILAITIVLWALLSFPKPPPEAPSQSSPIQYSVGGRIGKAMEPVLAPMGQDFRMGIAILGSFAAREVMVSTLGLVYGIESADENNPSLRDALQNDKDPQTGKPRYTPLRGLALMIFFVFACQCMSTLAVVRKETRSWRWPLFMFVSMTSVAYISAVLVYQFGRLLGFE